MTLLKKKIGIEDGVIGGVADFILRCPAIGLFPMINFSSHTATKKQQSMVFIACRRVAVVHFILLVKAVIH